MPATMKGGVSSSTLYRRRVAEAEREALAEYSKEALINMVLKLRRDRAKIAKELAMERWRNT